MDPLERLGDVGFQDFTAALVVDVVGTGVQVMGRGRDGGRDLYYRGDLSWGANGSDVWSGYTVMQVKHKGTIDARPVDNASWIWTQIRKELLDWSDPGSNREEVPQNLLFITNVPLSAVPRSGGHDRLHAQIDAFISGNTDDLSDASGQNSDETKERVRRLRQIQNFRIWSRETLTALISGRDSIRRGFRAFLTPADVLAHAADWTDKLPLEKITPALRSHSRAALVGDEGRVYFDEAGSGGMTGLPIHEVAVDLPVKWNAGSVRGSALRYVFDRAEHVLRPTQPFAIAPKHLVITGAPGNGKSTLAKYVVQAFRAAMLEGATDLSKEQQSAIDGMTESMRRLGRPLPGNKRWPVLIDLARYAENGGLQDGSTLTHAIAGTINRRNIDGIITPSLLNSWLGQWPSLIMLDGLDEVTDPRDRKELLSQIASLVSEADAQKWDTLVIVTTRPLGYTENIEPTQFERIDLTDLAMNEAVQYGLMVSKIRLQNNPDRLDLLERRFVAMSKEKSLANLLRTPLQVLIVTIIIESASQLSPDRYGLFWTYYQTVLSRERSKPGQFGRLLRDYSPQILKLHQRVGYELHLRSELSEHSFATLSMSELKNIAWQVLDEDEFQPETHHSELLARIVSATTQRLVLLVPRDAGIGFDVRSLQELMAAMQLTSGHIDGVLARMRLVAPSPHWRNAWLFAAGRIMTEPREHERDQLIEVLEQIDRDAPERLGKVMPIGPRLAIDVLDDGMVRSQPKWRARVLRVALGVFRQASGDDLRVAASAFLVFADRNEDQASVIADAMRQAAVAGPPSARLVSQLQLLMNVLAEDLSISLRARALVRVSETITPPMEGDAKADWEYFSQSIDTAPVDGDDAEVLNEIAGTFVRRAGALGLLDEAEFSLLQAALSRPNIARAFEDALFEAGQDSWVEFLLAQQIGPVVLRKALGDSLRAT